MQHLTILAVVFTLLLQTAVPQIIDPSTVDPGTKGRFDVKLVDEPGSVANIIVRDLV